MSASGPELRNALFKLLQDPLRSDGFSLKRRMDAFIRTHDESQSEDRFQLIFVSKRGLRRQLVSADAGVRFERVETIYHTISGTEPKYMVDTVTVGTSLRSTLEGNARRCEFILEREDQLAAVRDSIVSLFRDIAIPYYATYSSLPAIDHELNTEPLVRTPARGVRWTRSAYGIIVAKLVGRHNYRELVDVYRGVLRKADGFHLPRYEALVQQLEAVEP
ncbi:MAG TPA: hypothetical protein VGG28_12070 [Kofleriaceae bacterium]